MEQRQDNTVTCGLLYDIDPCIWIVSTLVLFDGYIAHINGPHQLEKTTTMIFKLLETWYAISVVLTSYRFKDIYLYDILDRKNRHEVQHLSIVIGRFNRITK